MARASARHILVDSEARCEELKKQIEAGTDFADVAKAHSTCHREKVAATWANSDEDKWSRSSTKSFSMAT
jgi:parvulin-like peptidyl-prolyl isomerase